MRYLLIIALFILANSKAYCQSEKYWQQQANYSIDVSLNDADHTLDAFEKIEYFNNSPDTLRFIWFHLWPNAYKNDRTAFSEQLLRNGRTDFYFSDDSSKGYINRLAFKVDGTNAVTEPHGNDIDIIKVVLSQALAPGKSVTITTPFHVKLPYNFSRGGHVGNDYQITQWYPKPAVYDSKGWHEMPYLDQGEFYSEFGNFDVKITVPEKYIIAATGQLQTAQELEKLKHFTEVSLQQTAAVKPAKKTISRRSSTASKPLPVKVTAPVKIIISTKTLHYTQHNVHDFAWFASKEFSVQYDTVLLQDKVVDVFTYSTPSHKTKWKESITYAKDALRFYSNRIGAYPYSTASVVSGSDNMVSSGMEYPTITIITTQSSGKNLDAVIAHELGHNWFYGALASNERDHAWMDEGMNSFYEKKYLLTKYGTPNKDKKFIEKRIPDDIELMLAKSFDKIEKGQSIDTISDVFTSYNYGLYVYTKGSLWMKELEKKLGPKLFEQSMKNYFLQWQNKHPYPLDFKQSIETTSGKKIDSLYQLLYNTPVLVKSNAIKKKIDLIPFFSLKNTDSINHISIAPIIGYNFYDKLMVGGLIHNYQLPLNRFQFLAAPMYATGSKAFNIFGRASYNTYKKGSWLEVSASIAKYTMDNFKPANAEQINQFVTRVVPSIKYTIYAKDLRSKEKYTFQFRSFLLREEGLQFKTIATPTGSVDVVSKQPEDNYINQLKITWSDDRVLYPYDLNLTVDQGKSFVRAGVTGNYFFNYQNNKGGVQARFFAGKFFYLQTRTIINAFQNERYHLNLTGPNGNEDYTYSGYYLGRNEFEGFRSQQIMQRDGFFKVRTDLYSNKVGKTDDWLVAMNFSGDIPNSINPLNILPFKIPVKIFADIGTYAEAWNENAASGKFLYAAGLQLSLFNDLINIYAPILSSKVFRDYNKRVLGENSFLKTISFTIDVQKIKPTLLNKNIPL